MTALTACSRCSKVLELKAEDESGDAVEAETVGVAGGGVLLAVCPECMTDSEVVEAARRSAAALLDIAEEAIADFEMLAERVPGSTDDPGFQAARTEAKRHAEEARAMLRALEGEAS